MDALDAVSGRAAEVFGSLWSDPPQEGSLSPGLTLAAALAGSSHHEDRLRARADQNNEAALAWCRLKTLHKDTDALSTPFISSAQQVEGSIAGDWIEALTIQIFKGPMDTGRMTGLQRQQILTLGQDAYCVARNNIDGREDTATVPVRDERSGRLDP